MNLDPVTKIELCCHLQDDLIHSHIRWVTTLVMDEDDFVDKAAKLVLTDKSLMLVRNHWTSARRIIEVCIYLRMNGYGV